MVKSAELFKRLRNLGLPLFETEDMGDVNLTLADVVRSRDLRLWEGFPVLLANAAKDGLFNYGKLRNYLKKSIDRAHLISLTAMSSALYKTSGLKFSWAERLHNSFGEEGKKKYEEFTGLLKNDLDVAVGRYKMSSRRLKNIFSNYFAPSRSGLGDLLSFKEDLGLEYSLSQVFSPKQKELFLKKLKGEKLTKTEKEYYSRVVKKKVSALANPELHRLAQKLLERS